MYVAYAKALGHRVDLSLGGGRRSTGYYVMPSTRKALIVRQNNVLTQVVRQAPATTKRQDFALFCGADPAPFTPYNKRTPVGACSTNYEFGETKV